MTSHSLARHTRYSHWVQLIRVIDKGVNFTEYFSRVLIKNKYSLCKKHLECKITVGMWSFVYEFIDHSCIWVKKKTIVLSTNSSYIVCFAKIISRHQISPSWKWKTLLHVKVETQKIYCFTICQAKMNWAKVNITFFFTYNLIDFFQ